MKILIGADPEVFAMKNGVFVSAHGLVRGDKKHPFKVDNGAVQVDGMALEFNIDPAESEDQFCLNIQSVFDTLKSMVPEYQVVATPVADFTEEYLKSQPAEALELGCDPDYNAWTKKENEKPNPKEPFRTASGHVHIGWGDGFGIRDSDHLRACAEVTKQMDFFLGLPSLLYDNDVRRRSLYGMAGAFRAKPYGAEYRVLSNAWLNSEKLMRWVYKNVMAGMDRLINGEALHEQYGDIQEIINMSKVEEANAIIKDAGILVPEV